MFKIQTLKNTTLKMEKIFCNNGKTTENGDVCAKTLASITNCRLPITRFQPGNRKMNRGVPARPQKIGPENGCILAFFGDFFST